MDVQVSITHTYVSDLDIFLIGPDGTRVELSTGNGGSGDNYSGTIFDDEATVVHHRRRAALLGPLPARRAALGASTASRRTEPGRWRSRTHVLQDPGVLMAWSLILTTGPDVLCDACTVTAPTGAAGLAALERREQDEPRMGFGPGASFYNLYRGVPADLPDLLDADATRASA